MEALGLNLLIAILVLGTFFVVYLKRQDPSIVDVAWTLSLTLMSMASFYLVEEKTISSFVFLLMTLIWGARLIVLLMMRYKKGQKDMRYDQLKISFSDAQTKKFFLFFSFQAAAAFLMSSSFIIAYQIKTLTKLQSLAFILFLIFISLEILADYQMFVFRKTHHGRPGVMRSGLWRYSRHPNYFFEILVWCTFALFGSSSLVAIVSWAVVLMLLYFILNVTGIPATEEHLLKIKGEAYKNYQATTSKFFPWFPKS